MLLITGATGLVGEFLLKELKKDKNAKVRCYVREDSKRLDKLKGYNVDVCFGDIADCSSLKKALKNIETIVHIVNIRFSPLVVKLAEEMNIKKIILIHTTGMFSKYQEYSREYEIIEKNLVQNIKIDYVILRPTMIYGGVEDRNMHKLIEYIKNKNIFPIFGDGKSLMQPIHAFDVALAIHNCIYNKKVINKCYNISGGTIITYKKLIKVISDKLQKKVKILYIPYWLSMILIDIYVYLCKLKSVQPKITKEQVKRLSEDKVFSHRNANTDFDFVPLSFDEGIDYQLKYMVDIT